MHDGTAGTSGPTAHGASAPSRAWPARLPSTLSHAGHRQRPPGGRPYRRGSPVRVPPGPSHRPTALAARHIAFALAATVTAAVTVAAVPSRAAAAPSGDSGRSPQHAPPLDWGGFGPAHPRPVAPPNPPAPSPRGRPPPRARTLH